MTTTISRGEERFILSIYRLFTFTCGREIKLFAQIPLLRLHVTEMLFKRNFFFFSLSSAFLGRLAIGFYSCFRRLLLKTRVTNPGLFQWTFIH